MRAAYAASSPRAYREVEFAAKRALDVLVAGVGLFVIFPLLVLIALAVKLTDRGPVLFEWNVVGKGGRPFTGYKFRTMVVNAEAMEQDLQAQNEVSGPAFKIRNDPRVTRVGRVLRKYSLDELPQLWSVLKGDMSLVGPRPARRHEYARLNAWQRQRVSVTPGVTGLWQVSGRSTLTDFDDWVRLDLQYIETWSLALDLKILLRTVPYVLRGHGAW